MVLYLLGAQLCYIPTFCLVWYCWTPNSWSMDPHTTQSFHFLLEPFVVKPHIKPRRRQRCIWWGIDMCSTHQASQVACYWHCTIIYSHGAYSVLRWPSLLWFSSVWLDWIQLIIIKTVINRIASQLKVGREL